MVNLSEEMIRKAQSAASAEELIDLAAKEGITLTADDAKQCFDLLHPEAKTGELSDDDLENIAGGKEIIPEHTYSSDPPYRLIVTALNSCPACIVDGKKKDSFCIFCDRRYSTGINPTIYCEYRKKGRDPYA